MNKCKQMFYFQLILYFCFAYGRILETVILRAALVPTVPSCEKRCARVVKLYLYLVCKAYYMYFFFFIWRSSISEAL